MKLSRLINLYWWMDQDGHTTRVPDTGHNLWARLHLNHLGKYDPKEDVYPQMFRLGWIRVALVNYSADNKALVFNSNPASDTSPNPRQLSALKELANKYSATELRDDTKRKRHDIDESVLNETKSPYIVVGAADEDFNIIMSNKIDTHIDLTRKYGWGYGKDKYHWRYNSSTQTIYWYEDVSGQLKSAVKDAIHEKFPYYRVTRNVQIDRSNPGNYHKLQSLAHGTDLQENVLTETKLRGEWWIDNHGQATFADGDAGDVNHEGVVRDYLIREFLGYFDIESDEEYVEPLGKYEDQIKQHFVEEGNINNEVDSEKYDNDPARYMLKVLGSRRVIKDKKQLAFAFFIAYGTTSRDAREYALVYWKWKRVKGEWIETWNLTSEDVKIMYRGLWDAYSDALGEPEEGEEEPVFNIEVRSNNTRYYNVPIEVMKSGNVMALYQYRNKTDLEEEEKNP